MRIFINALATREGGGVTYLNQILLEWIKNNKLEIFLFGGTKILPEIHSAQNVHCKNFSWAQKYLILRFFVEKFYFPFYLLKNKIDIAFFPNSMITGWVPADIPKITVFQNMLAFDSDNIKKYPLGMRLRLYLLKFLYKKSYKKADYIVFISRYAQSVIKKYLPSIQEKSTVIYHGVSEIFRLDSDFNPEAYCLYVSNFDPYKHHIELISAWKIFKTSFGYVPKLKLIGFTSSYVQKIKRFICQENLQNEIDIIESLDHKQLPSCYEKARLIIFASSCENCPNILLEAMASGRPILCSEFLPMPEILGSGGIYFNPSDPKSIFLALKQALLLESQHQLQNRVGHIRERSLNFSWEKNARKTLNILYEQHFQFLAKRFQKSRGLKK